MMNEMNHQPNADRLDQALAALRGEAIPEAPPPRVIASTIEALQAQERQPDVVRFQHRRQVMFRIARYSSLAAAALVFVVLAASIFLIDRNASLAFADVVDNVKKAKSVSFVLKQRINDRPEIKSKMMIRGDMVRYEMPGFAMIIVPNGKKAIELYSDRMIAKRIDLDGKLPMEAFREPIDRLRKLKGDIKDKVIQQGDEEIDGKKCHVYQIKEGENTEVLPLIPGPFKLWADAKTGLPVKILVEDKMMALTYEQFKWDEPLNAELFSLAIPSGYVVEELTPAVVKPGRIYYHQGGTDMRSIQPDGKKPELQFVPRDAEVANSYVSQKSELSPDGCFLALAYTNTTNDGGFPPYRVLLWDRTKPKEDAVEIYSRPEGELQGWQFFADGTKLLVTYWEGIGGRKTTKGQYGAEIVDLKAKTKQPVKLPTYTDGEGKEQSTLLAAITKDGSGYLVIGDGLQLATAEGTLVRRLSAAKVPVPLHSVRLSPDGKQAVFAISHQGDMSQQLLLVTLARGETKELVPAHQYTDMRAGWSPDGKQIAYTSRLLDTQNGPFSFGKETYLVIVNSEGGNAKTLLTEKVNPKAPSLELTAWR